MPYIKQSERIKYELLDNIKEIKTKGELEYCVFKLMKKFMVNKEWKYSNLHDCIYAVIHTAHEFQRRFLDMRETKAMVENGDII